MTDKSQESIDFLDITSVTQGIEALQYLEGQLKLLGKRIKKELVNFRDWLTERYRSQLRNEIVGILDFFRVDSLTDFSRASQIVGKELAAALSDSHLAFEGLKQAVIQAAAPLVQLFVPVVQTAIAFLTQLAQLVAGMVSLLITGTDKSADYAAGLKSVGTASNALKRSLAGFDQINRLGGKNGGLGSLQVMSGGWKDISAKMQALFKPLRELDLSAAIDAMERLKKAVEPVTKELFAGLEWAWHNIFVPLAQWTVTQLLPTFLDTLTVLMQQLARVIEELKPDFEWLWQECLLPLAQWKGDQIIGSLEGIQQQLNKTSDWLGLNQGPVDKFISSMRNLIQAAGELAQKALELGQTSGSTGELLTHFKDAVVDMFNPFREASGMFSLITGAVNALGLAFDGVRDAATGAKGAMDQVTQNGWGQLKQNLIDPAYSGVRQAMNRVIDMANTLLRSTATGVNFLGKALNTFSFTVPNWVPGIGGRGFSFGIKPVTAPQIPYLARGAVLPANRPFMAVVGDQKYGTNIEAPLAVIEQAVAGVMEDYAAANLAGHQATVGVLQELLSAVLGIRIGEDLLCDAAARYNGKMAVVRGGYV